ncbi:MAG: hypothetical protein AAGI28_15775 [Pseudomonadota bacterium]
MKTIVIAAAAVVVISVGASVILGEAGFSSQEQTSGSAVRLD